MKPAHKQVLEAFLVLWEDYKPVGPRVEILFDDGTWQPLPLAWNEAKRIADLVEGVVRLYNGDKEIRRYKACEDIIA